MKGSCLLRSLLLFHIDSALLNLHVLTLIFLCYSNKCILFGLGRYNSVDYEVYTTTPFDCHVNNTSCSTGCILLYYFTTICRSILHQRSWSWRAILLFHQASLTTWSQTLEHEFCEMARVSFHTNVPCLHRYCCVRTHHWASIFHGSYPNFIMVFWRNPFVEWHSSEIDFWRWRNRKFLYWYWSYWSTSFLSFLLYTSFLYVICM
jgi:hypothetical protein